MLIICWWIASIVAVKCRPNCVRRLSILCYYQYRKARIKKPTSKLFKIPKMIEVLE